ncbi:OprD family porin [Pseudomonas sp. MOB-449]|nr:OprD family porin [Pseudomonas sp. MOB-449]
MDKKTSRLLTIGCLALLCNGAAKATGIIDDSHATLSLRNVYFNQDNREGPSGQTEEWGRLKTDLRYFHTGSSGKNASRTGRAAGNGETGATRGEVDNRRPGLSGTVAYLKGHGIRSAQGDLKEWERDFTLGYVLQSGPLIWRNASLRSQASADTNQNPLILTYNPPLF